MVSLAESIKRWANELGFQACGICRANPEHHGDRYMDWLAKENHGEMDYMSTRKEMRLNPANLHENSLSVISVRMDYRVRQASTIDLLDDDTKAYIAEYALGRDYHKLIRKRLGSLCDRIRGEFSGSSQRPFVDSAPILERAYAELSGLGWIGKNTMLINNRAGSWFFLGEILTDLPLPPDRPQQSNHCGSCTACLEVCPTGAFTREYELDARKCISYLTIELKSEIPVEYRDAIGNRVFGCDDCQMVCPWNKFSERSGESDFLPRHSLDNVTMLELFRWSEDAFLHNTRGSPIRRLGYERWLRNLAVGLGNGKAEPDVVSALREKRGYSPLVTEHVDWALKKLGSCRGEP